MKKYLDFLKESKFLKDGLTPLNAGPVKKHKYDDSELFEEIEDRLMTDGIFDKWECIEKNYSKHPIHSHQTRFRFVFDTKSTTGDFSGRPEFGDKLYLYPRSKYIRTKDDYHNSKMFDQEVEEMKKMINWKIIQHIGVTTDRFTWHSKETDTRWDGGVYDGRLKEKAVIVLELTRPSWWDGEPIPYREVSDKEAGIR
jgi:hypothetical protein